MFCVNAQKQYVGLCVGTIEKIENAEALLDECNWGKNVFLSKNSKVGRLGWE